MRLSREKHLVYLGFIVAALPLICLRDFTPSNELRYLSIADEALRRGTLFAFMCHGAPYADKPPLYLWIVMACRWLTGGHHMWLLSLFSLIPALGIVKVMDDWVHNEMDANSRSIARLMTLTSGVFLVSALTIRMDMLMSLFIVLALNVFWKMYACGMDATPSLRQRLLFPLFIFLAVFTKGPLGFLIPLLCTVVFAIFFSTKPRKERLRLLDRVWGWPTWIILLTLCALWFGAVYAEGGPAYLHNLLFHQTFGRAVNAFHHQHPFYYYAVVIWYCLAPWSPLIIAVIVMALRRSVVKSDLQRFFLTVSVVTFILLSCISSKLEIYLLPAIPFMVYGATMFLPRYIKSAARGSRIIRGIAVDLLVIGFAGGCAMPWVNAYIGYGRICEAAKAVSAECGVNVYKAWRIKQPENMDVYLHQNVVKIPEDSLPKAVADRPYILLTKRKELSHFKGFQTQIVGDKAIVVCSVRRQLRSKRKKIAAQTSCEVGVKRN
jgi:4-amino-4-deoxy-L-arabinose transferase-like glycosyltransferase